MSFLPFLRAVCRRPAWGLAALSLALVACGGGGGGSADGPAASPVTLASALAPSSQLADVCTVEGEQAFARSLLDERYLWWDRIPPVDAKAHATVQSYFEALVLRSPDASGHPVDRFSAVLSSASADALLGATRLPAAAVVSRGNEAAPLASILASAQGRSVGYLLFDKHAVGAQDALIDAVHALRKGGIQELVLDLRHNPGGYLHIAQSVASMAAGPQHLGRVFEELRYSDKRAKQGRTLRFVDRVQTGESRYGVGQPLPQLDLPRLYVLATGMTCSASESIVNSLRGVGIEVVIVGQTTCGKPYGFHRQDNCGKSYFAIEFQTLNDAGRSDYGNGFEPQCAVAPDPRATLGDPREPLLAAALQHIDAGTCPTAVTPKSAPHRDPAMGLAGRLLAPE